MVVVEKGGGGMNRWIKSIALTTYIASIAGGAVSTHLGPSLSVLLSASLSLPSDRHTHYNLIDVPISKAWHLGFISLLSFFRSLFLSCALSLSFF
jgi:hypothetical protein